MEPTRPITNKIKYDVLQIKLDYSSLIVGKTDFIECQKIKQILREKINECLLKKFIITQQSDIISILVRNDYVLIEDCMFKTGEHSFSLKFNKEVDYSKIVLLLKELLDKNDIILSHEIIKFDYCMKNGSVPGNFTLYDMLEIFGHPLPDNLRNALIFYQRMNNINFFDCYHKLHLKSKAQQWWPEGIVIHDIFKSNYSEFKQWMDDFNISEKDVVYNKFSIDFKNKIDAMKFKLTFGEKVINLDKLLYNRWRPTIDLLWADYLYNLSPEDRGSYKP